MTSNCEIKIIPIVSERFSNVVGSIHSCIHRVTKRDASGEDSEASAVDSMMGAIDKKVVWTD